MKNAKNKKLNKKNEITHQKYLDTSKAKKQQIVRN